MEKLTEPIQHQAPQKLNGKQRQEIKQMLLEKTPRDYGIERNLWTAKVIIQVIDSQWNVKLSDSRI